MMTEQAILERFRSWDGLSRLEAEVSRRRRGPNFFHLVPRIFRVEGVHSDLLAWLLDPQGWHGLGDAFAAPFVEAALREAGVAIETPVAIDSVQREFSTGEGPVDILIRLRAGGTRIALGIENKIDSPLGDEQLHRYARGLAKCFPDERVVLVLLTPAECETEAPECAFAGLTYRHVVGALDAAVSGGESDAPVGKALARHYLDMLKRDIVPEPQPEIDAILRELCEQHKEAWRLIRRRLPSEKDDCHASLATAVCERLSTPDAPAWQFVVRRNTYVRVFDPRWSRLGHTDASTFWPAAGAHAATRYSKAHFRLAADPPNDDSDQWRYTVKLRLDVRNDPALGRALHEDLQNRRVIKPADLGNLQLTPTLKTSTKLPGLTPDAAPDAVVDWFVGEMKKVVDILDTRLR